MNTVTLIDLDDASASSGNSLLSVVAQLSLSLGVACAGALLGGFTAEIGNDGVSTVLGAFQLTFVTVGIMAMLAATIFFAAVERRRTARQTSGTAHRALGRMAMGLIHCATFCFAGQSRDHHRHRF